MEKEQDRLSRKVVCTEIQGCISNTDVITGLKYLSKTCRPIIIRTVGIERSLEICSSDDVQNILAVGCLLWENKSICTAGLGLQTAFFEVEFDT